MKQLFKYIRKKLDFRNLVAALFVLIVIFIIISVIVNSRNNSAALPIQQLPPNVVKTVVDEVVQDTVQSDIFRDQESIIIDQPNLTEQEYNDIVQLLKESDEFKDKEFMPSGELLRSWRAQRDIEDQTDLLENPPRGM